MSRHLARAIRNSLALVGLSLAAGRLIVTNVSSGAPASDCPQRAAKEQAAEVYFSEMEGSPIWLIDHCK